MIVLSSSLTLAAVVILVVFVAFLLALVAAAVRILREYERGVVFRLGRLLGTRRALVSSS